METQTNTPAITWHTESFWTSADTNLINAAMVKFHGLGIAVPKNGTASITAQVKRKYMLLDDILTTVRPALAGVGCFMEQHLAGHSVVTRIVHESGQFIASAMPYQTWEGGAVNNLMKMGGGLSYLRRYAAAAILALPSDEDSDAEGVDHMGAKSAPAATAASAAAIAPNPATVTSAKSSLPWLNLTGKDGKTTDAGAKAIEYIEGGGKVADILKKYRVNKTDMATLQDCESKVKHYTDIEMTKLYDNGDTDYAPF
mgnify:CR=1 FL=1